MYYIYKYMHYQEELRNYLPVMLPVALKPAAASQPASRLASARAVSTDHFGFAQKRQPTLLSLMRHSNCTSSPWLDDKIDEEDIVRRYAQAIPPWW